MAASLCGHLAAVKFLLDRGARIDELDGEGKSALDLAKTGRHVEIQQALESAAENR